MVRIQALLVAALVVARAGSEQLACERALALKASHACARAHDLSPATTLDFVGTRDVVKKLTAGVHNVILSATVNEVVSKETGGTSDQHILRPDDHSVQLN